MSMEEYTSVRVVNVSKEANDVIISSFFSFCGEITSIDIHDGNSSNYPDTNEVVITFGSHDAAKMAEVLTNTAFLDKDIVITPYIKSDTDGGSEAASAPEKGDSEESSASADSNNKNTTEPKDGNDDDDNNDNKSEAKVESAPSSGSTENVPDGTPAKDAKEDASDEGAATKDETKDETKGSDEGKRENENNDNPEGGAVIHKLGEMMADGYLITEDLKKYDKELGLSEGIKNSVTAVDNTLGLSSAFSAASNFVSSQIKEIDQQTGISQAAGKLMGEVSESPYFASTFSMFRGWGASISKAYNAVCRESTTILEGKKAPEENTESQQQQQQQEQ